MMHTCTLCGKGEPAATFYHNAATGRPRSRCKQCMYMLAKRREARKPRAAREAQKARYREAQRRRRAADQGKAELQNLRSHLKPYGITVAQFRSMEAEQAGRCAVCGRKPEELTRNKTKRLGVDHDHDTGRIRGLLCRQCNIAIGFLEHDPVLCRKAAAYLSEADA